MAGVGEEKEVAAAAVQGLKIPSRQRYKGMRFRLWVGGGNLVFSVSRARFTGPYKIFYGSGNFAGSILCLFAVFNPQRAVIMRVSPFCVFC